MSGGHFDYKQYHISDIRSEIEHQLRKQGQELPKSELFSDEEYYTKYPKEKYEITYSPTVQRIFRDGIQALHKAEIYAHRIDWYLSGDDGEERLIERLNEELTEAQLGFIDETKRLPAKFGRYLCKTKWIDSEDYVYTVLTFGEKGFEVTDSCEHILWENRILE